MDHVNFPYRSSSHLALMHVISESGAWERQGLRVDYDKPIDLKKVIDDEFVAKAVAALGKAKN